MSGAPLDGQLLGLDDLSKRLGVWSVPALRRAYERWAAAKGMLPSAKKVGARWLTTQSLVSEWLRSIENAARAEATPPKRRGWPRRIAVTEPDIRSRTQSFR